MVGLKLQSRSSTMLPPSVNFLSVLRRQLLAGAAWFLTVRIARSLAAPSLSSLRYAQLAYL